MRIGIYWKAILILALLVAFVGARAWRSYEQHQPKPPKPPVTYVRTVDSVPTGASIVVKEGVRDRRKVTIFLAGVMSPVDGEWKEASRASLEKLAGSQVRFDTPRHGIFGQALSDEGAERIDLFYHQVMTATGGSIGVVVYGESGQCLNLEQINSGMADCPDSADLEYLAAKKSAQKLKKGIWK